MKKKTVWAVIAVFALFYVADFIIHGIILTSSYQQTMYLWRPFPEMKTTLLYLNNLIYSIAFVWLYTMLSNKGPFAGLKFGLILGVAYGFGMGFATYASMPITSYIALIWFLGTAVKMGLSGIVIGSIVK